MNYHRVSAGYFETMGIPLRAGRTFGAGEKGNSADVAIIDEAAAALYFPGVDAVGKQVRTLSAGDTDAWLTIVGVVGNTATAQLGEDTPVPKLYLPLRTSLVNGTPPTHEAIYVLRTQGDPVTFVPAVRRAVAELDPNLAIARPEPLTDVVSRAGARLAFTMVLLVLSAGMALFLGILGIYAVISYSVAQRRGEIGVRLALGAEPGAVTAMILRQSGRVIALGVVVGIGAAVASARLIRALLFGVAWNDPLTYAGVAAGLFGMAMLACWLPARRAAQRDPVEALRG